MASEKPNQQPTRPLSEYVAACEAKGCCPLGAALDPGGGNPMPEGPRAALLGLPAGTRCEIASLWDGQDRHAAVERALSAGLGPAMDRYLFGDARTPAPEGRE
jgi:hypothetical protein